MSGASFHNKRSLATPSFSTRASFLGVFPSSIRSYHHKTPPQYERDEALVTWTNTAGSSFSSSSSFLAPRYVFEPAAPPDMPAAARHLPPLLLLLSLPSSLLSSGLHGPEEAAREGGGPASSSAGDNGLTAAGGDVMSVQERVLTPSALTAGKQTQRKEGAAPEQVFCLCNIF